MEIELKQVREALEAAHKVMPRDTAKPEGFFTRYLPCEEKISVEFALATIDRLIAKLSDQPTDIPEHAKPDDYDPRGRMTAEGLLPCPFCGSKDVELDEWAQCNDSVKCNDCWAWGPIFKEFDGGIKAIEAWNRRIPDRQGEAPIAEPPAPDTNSPVCEHSGDECIQTADAGQPVGLSFVDELQSLLAEPVNTEKGSAGYWTNFGLSLAIEVARKRGRESQAIQECDSAFDVWFGDILTAGAHRNACRWFAKEAWQAAWKSRRIAST